MSDICYKGLLIGNGMFPEDPHNLPNLKGPQNDLRLLRDVLTHTEVGLHEPANVRSLLDCTRSEMMEAAEEFFQDAKRDDQLLFYYSGHGRLDLLNALYLCARDTRTNSLVATALPDGSLNAMIQRSRSRRILIMLDCCHSGRFKGSDAPRNLFGEGRFVLASSRAEELSEDAPAADAPSAFTKFCVDALLSGEVDPNTDGLVSINELYDYVLPRLNEATKQLPQRQYDQAVGELAIGRSTRKRSTTPGPVSSINAAAIPASDARPILGVSTEAIEIGDVQPGEELPEEIVDVFNQGSGTLDWSVECSDDWISLERHKGYFKVRLAPKIGTNRGRIYVRERGGSAKRIVVSVKVIEAAKPPALTLSHDSVHFGTVHLDAKAPTHTVKLINAGGGKLNARVSSSDDRIEARLTGDLLEIDLGTSRQGKISGAVVIESDGGTVSLPVTGKVEVGPVIEVEPRRVDFGRVLAGARPSQTLSIRNAGGGKLKWDLETRGDFFTIELITSGLIVHLGDDEGTHRGSIFISSNGGKVTVDVEATVESEPVAPSPPMQFRQAETLSIAGTWATPGIGAFVFAGRDAAYQYTEYNVFGQPVGQGSAILQGNVVQLNGMNMMAGPIAGSFAVNGNLMSGTIRGVFGQMPVTMARA